ncbi:MAG: hypothetical protein ACKPB3_10125 [Bacteroidota bacterium]
MIKPTHIPGALILVIASCLFGCSKPLDQQGHDIVQEVENRKGEITEEEWRRYDSLMTDIENKFQEKGDAWPDSVREAFNKDLGKYKMLRLMHEIEGFKSGMKDALDQFEGAMDVVRDSLDIPQGNQ